MSVCLHSVIVLMDECLAEPDAVIEYRCDRLGRWEEMGEGGSDMWASSAHIVAVLLAEGVRPDQLRVLPAPSPDDFC